MSGFLTDYAQLHKGEPGQAFLTYVNPSANFRKYNAIMLDPIKVYPSNADSALAKMSPEDTQKLLNYLDAAIRRDLSPSYSFVTTPGPTVMHFRIAITEGHPGNVPLDVMSSVIPITLAISGMSSVVVGEGLGVGSIGGEFEALDSETNERLAASVDARIGNKFTGTFNKFRKWRAARDAFDHWAQMLQTRLAALRAGGTPLQ